eukprot:1604497-Pleurochrysis_carterae.AAC.1
MGGALVLRYISFPTQVLSKSCKMVPVMMMGYLVSRKQYSLFEYIVAIMVRGARHARVTLTPWQQS